uniref:Tetraspanin n=1 Tax=Panstrongylus lignarius TaxID=156445 RepID=A0A224XJR8_9HEMI
MGFCECTAKFALFAFNLICALLGLVIIAFSVVTNIHGKPFKDMLSGQITLVTIILIVVGVLVFCIAFLGCCGAIRESHCMLTTYAVILSTLLVVQFAIGITAFVYRNKIEDSLNSVINQTFENDKAVDIVDEIQMDLQCCGLDGPIWYKSVNLPSSCCGRTKGKTCFIIEAYIGGCHDKIIDLVQSSLKLLGAIAIGISVIELICVIFAFCLSSSFKRW